MTISTSRYSGGRAALLETVEIYDDETTLRYVYNFTDLVATTAEDGEVTFTALAMDSSTLTDPDQSDNGAQEMTIALDNIDGVLSRFAYQFNRKLAANTTSYSAHLIRRAYFEDDLTAPVQQYSMEIKSASYNASSAEFTCGYMNVLDYAWPRITYTTTRFPGIEYL